MQPGDTPHPRSIEQDQILLDAVADLGLAFAQELRPRPGEPRYTPVQARALLESFQEVARIIRRTILLKHSLPRIAARVPTSDRDPAPRGPFPRSPAPSNPQPRAPDAEPRMRLDEIDTLRADLEEIRRATARPPASSPPAPNRPNHQPAARPNHPSPAAPNPAMARFVRDLAHIAPRLRGHDPRARTLAPAGAGPTEHPTRPPNPD